MLEQLSGLIIHLIESLSYAGVFLLMTLESALIPIPSEITLPFAGFLAQKGTFSLALVIAVATLGDIAGTMILYTIGWRLEESIVEKLVEKYGKFILISRHEYDTVMNWMKTKGVIIIFIAKLLPGFRTIIGLPAGLSEVPFKKALLYTTAGSLLWCGIFTYIGFALGANWNKLEPVFRKFELAIVVILILGAAWYINHKLKFVKFGKTK